MEDAVHESRIPDLELVAKGKVRDIYAVDDEHLLIVATDRISAFDVVLPDPIPGKGIVLTALSNFWFERTAHIVRNHLAAIDPADVLAGTGGERYANRAMVVKRLSPLPFEAVVRGYLLGSGWADYCSTGTVCGVSLPPHLRLAERLPEPMFTPATKAADGEHDENISFHAMAATIDPHVAGDMRDVAVRLYEFAYAHAAERGIIIADTKFEFALHDGELLLIDEVLTPDSSRFWPAASWRPGENPPSFDKQFVRDYLATLDWDRTAPGPRLPPEVIEGTRERYAQVLQLLSG